MEKLEAVMADLEKAYQEVMSIHEQLTKAVEEAEEDHILGYDHVYSEDALSAFTAQQTAKYEDANDLLEERIDSLKAN